MPEQGPMKFRKKPIVIEAIQLRWDTWGAVCDFVPRPWFLSGVYLDPDGKETTDTNGRCGLRMKTLESEEFIAQEGDWIVKGIGGEFYPVRDNIFRETYDPVE